MSEQLKPCACGKVPTELVMANGAGNFRVFIFGAFSDGEECCNNWTVCLTKDWDISSPKHHRDYIYPKMIKAWNAAPRPPTVVLCRDCNEYDGAGPCLHEKSPASWSHIDNPSNFGCTLGEKRQ